VRKYLLAAVKAVHDGKEAPHMVRDQKRNRFPHVDCFAELLPADVHWRKHFDYLTATAEKENPAGYAPKQKAVS